jgi:hypothetical protein
MGGVAGYLQASRTAGLTSAGTPSRSDCLDLEHQDQPSPMWQNSQSTTNYCVHVNKTQNKKNIDESKMTKHVQ